MPYDIGLRGPLGCREVRDQSREVLRERSARKPKKSARGGGGWLRDAACVGRERTKRLATKGRLLKIGFTHMMGIFIEFRSVVVDTALLTSTSARNLLIILLNLQNKNDLFSEMASGFSFCPPL